ncbi:hypothetical protein BUALT_Bualt04G0131600 [Buddleja alternifolia]|uniref:RING-type E3 ubiquitin transferase n=1 Tax=Buddleja alternifolia TaxID=168488 RepID=A0AAV6XVD4_9LAMI|nr:hypothetical protein BUALT_Bualt04G0131600 [Buddleja alternifolia]
MGAACCCLRVDYEDFANPNSSIYRNCICLRCFVQNFLHLYASLFHRGERLALPSSTQGTTSLSPMASLDNSLADMYRSPPRPLPYDADPRYVRLQQRDGLVSRREKGSSHLHEETEPLRKNEVDEESESFEYTTENPKIITKCSHHFHLGCIYEWMERSDNCPVCGKVMAFDETT